MFNSIRKFFVNYLVDFVTAILFIAAFVLVYMFNGNGNVDGKSQISIIPYVALFGFFLAWLQFLHYKHKHKKESAVSYFPKPLDLEKIENEIDSVIRFWNREDTLHSFEVSLMMGNDISEDEYKLIWNSLSISKKIYLIEKLNKLRTEKIEAINVIYISSLDPFIKELFVETRRKLNSYLNQMEGYALAVNKGIIDRESAHELFSHKFSNHYMKAYTYINAVRKAKGSPTLYIELEHLVNSWKNK